MSKINILRITYLVVTLTLLSIPTIFFKPINVYPIGDTENGYASSDIQWGGSSISKVIEHSNSSIRYLSHLKSDYKYPFSGYSLSFEDTKLNFKYRNRLSYKISSSQGTPLRLNIGIVLKDKDNFIYQSDIQTGKEIKSRSIPLKFFTPADWWYAAYNLTEEDFPPPSLSSIVLFSIVNSSETPIDIEEIVTVEEIKAYLSPAPFIFLTIILTLALGFLEYKNLKSNRANKLKYKEIKVNGESINEKELILSYIGENYNDSEINVETISKDTCVPKYKISQTIKDDFSLTVPGYINSIRVEEVKRLLTETDEPILDISISVGYNSVSHFNRIFKKLVGITPLNYRKSSKK